MSSGKIVGREGFLQNISRRLGRTSPLTTRPVESYSGVPEYFKDIAPDREELLELFMRNWTALTGKVLVVKQEEAQEVIRAYLRDIIQEQQITRVAAWEHAELHGLGLHDWLQEDGVSVVPWREDGGDGLALASTPDPALHNTGHVWLQQSRILRAAETCQMGIVWADAAIAHTGTLALLARGGKGRSVSLLVDTLVAIFRTDQLVYRMGEAFSSLLSERGDPARLASSLNFITGPSRSSDIQNDLMIGVHGPGKAHAVIIE